MDEDLIDDWDEADYEVFNQWDEETKNKRLEELDKQIQQKENILKEVSEYIADRVTPEVNDYNIEFRLKLNTTVDEFIKHLSEILDKENK